MAATIKQVLIILGLVVALSVEPATTRRQAAQDLDDAQILALPIPYDVDFTGPPQQTLWSLLHDVGVSIGIVQEFHRCSSESQIRLKIKKGTTIRGAMDILVASNPDFQWHLLDHVINLEPKGGVPALLTTKLHRVQLHTFDNWAASAGMSELLRMPELRRRFDELKIKGGVQTGDGPSAVNTHPVPLPPPPKAVEINLHDVTVQDVFNEIVRIHGKETWYYAENDCNGVKTYSIHSWKN
jgi:hypothetical protein